MQKHFQQMNYMDQMEFVLVMQRKINTQINKCDTGINKLRNRKICMNPYRCRERNWLNTMFHDRNLKHVWCRNNIFPDNQGNMQQNHYLHLMKGEKMEVFQKYPELFKEDQLQHCYFWGFSQSHQAGKEMKEIKLGRRRSNYCLWWWYDSKHKWIK